MQTMTTPLASVKPSPRCTAHRKGFALALALASKVAMRKAPKPILTHVLFSTTGDGSATLTATDLQIAIRVRVLGVRAETPGQLAIDAKPLHDRFKGATDDDLVISAGPAGVDVIGADSRASVPCLPADGFPSFPGPDARDVPDARTVDLANFAECLSRCLMTSDVQSTRYALGGVHVELSRDSAQCMGTDGRRLTVVPLDMTDGSDPGTDWSRSITLTVGACKAIIAIASHCKGGDVDATIAILRKGKGQPSTDDPGTFFLSADGGSVAFYARGLEGRFPRIDDVIQGHDKARGTLATMDATPFADATRAALAATNDECHGVDVLFHESRMHLRVERSGVTYYAGSVPCTLAGPTNGTCLDARWLAETMKGLPKRNAGSVSFSLTGHKGVTCVTRGRTSVYIMPLTAGETDKENPLLSQSGRSHLESILNPAPIAPIAPTAPPIGDPEPTPSRAPELTPTTPSRAPELETADDTPAPRPDVSGTYAAADEYAIPMHVRRVNALYRGFYRANIHDGVRVWEAESPLAGSKYLPDDTMNSWYRRAYVAIPSDQGPDPEPTAETPAPTPVPSADRKAGRLIERGPFGDPTGRVFTFAERLADRRAERDARRVSRACDDLPPVLTDEEIEDAYRDALERVQGYDRKEIADATRAVRRAYHSVPTVRARIAAQDARALARLPERFALFGGQTPDERPIDAPTALEIADARGNARVYHATPYPVGPDGLRSYRIERADARGDYDVSETPQGRPTCTCPDYVHRAREAGPGVACKHVAALEARGLVGAPPSRAPQLGTPSRAHELRTAPTADLSSMVLLVAPSSEVVSRVDTATLPAPDAPLPTPTPSGPSSPLEGPGRGVAALHGLFLADWAAEVSGAYRFGRVDREHYDRSMDEIEPRVRRLVPGFAPRRLTPSRAPELGGVPPSRAPGLTEARPDFSDPVTRAGWLSWHTVTHHTDRLDFDATPETPGDLTRYVVRCRQLGRAVGSVELEGDRWVAYHDEDPVGLSPTMAGALALVADVQDAIIYD